MGRVAAAAAVAALVAATLIAPRLSAATPQQAARTATVTRANVTQTVEVSGTVNADQVKLSFRPQGRLAEVKVKVGDVVAAGQILARLETADLEAAVKRAEADLLSAQAKYDSTVAGATAEDLALARNSLESATTGYEQALRGAESAVEDAQDALADAGRALDDARTGTGSDVASARQAYDKATQSYALARNTLEGAVTDLRSELAAYRKAIVAARAGIAAALAGSSEVLQTSDTTAARNSLNAAEVSLAGSERQVDEVVAPSLEAYARALAELLEAADAFDAALASGSDTVPLIAPLAGALAGYDSAASGINSAIDTAGSGVSSALSAMGSALSALDSLATQDRWVLDPVRGAVVQVQNGLIAAQQTSAGMKGDVAGTGVAAGTVESSVSGSLVSARDAYADAERKASSSVETATDAYAEAQRSLANVQDKQASTAESQRISLEGARIQYLKATAGSKASDIALAQASVLLAEIALDKARADLAGATLTAPVGGAIASVDGEVGETPASPLVVLALTHVLTLRGTVGEADIAKLTGGQAAVVAIDAIGTGTRLRGRVTALDPLATVQSGVPVYGVDVAIEGPDPAIRSGMSGTATVIVASKQGVLTIPNSAVRAVAGEKVVQVMRDGVATSVAVTLGISSGTVTEVTGGLEEGDEVVLPSARTTTTTGQQTGPAGGFGGGPPTIIRR